MPYFTSYSVIFPSFFPELANAGRPLFPGNDVDDQLKRIFKYPYINPMNHKSFEAWNRYVLFLVWCIFMSVLRFELLNIDPPMLSVG